MSAIYRAVSILAKPMLASLAALTAPLLAGDETKQLQGFTGTLSVTQAGLGPIVASAVLSDLRVSFDGPRSRSQAMTVPSVGENIPGAGQ